ncbi:transposase [Streptomyces sp. RB17]|uniref:transposase n=1 Tax=Streptomyces sp. RB17 TaxID=2585197 RepID=UPI003A4C8281
MLRLVVLVECGTRAVLAAAFGPESDGELTYAGRLLSGLDRTMLLLADAGFDANEFARDVQATGAQFLVRSSARRIPTSFLHLGDGSYLARMAYARKCGRRDVVKQLRKQLRQLSVGDPNDPGYRRLRYTLLLVRRARSSRERGASTNSPSGASVPRPHS